MTKIISPTTDLTKVNLKVPNQDVEIHLKTVGATTASVVSGAKIGWIIALLDIMKGFLPTLAFRLLFPGTNYFLIF
ncbi:MAG: glycerol-3-phosphate acyltransferase, partial [Anaerolineales bacterium]